MTITCIPEVMHFEYDNQLHFFPVLPLDVVANVNVVELKK